VAYRFSENFCIAAWDYYLFHLKNQDRSPRDLFRNPAKLFAVLVESSASAFGRLWQFWMTSCGNHVKCGSSHRKECPTKSSRTSLSFVKFGTVTGITIRVILVIYYTPTNALLYYNNLKYFTLEHLKCSYMFRSLDHPQGAHFVSC